MAGAAWFSEAEGRIGYDAAATRDRQDCDLVRLAGTLSGAGWAS